MPSAPASLTTLAESALDVLPVGCVGPHGRGVEGTLNWRGCALRGLCTLVLTAVSRCESLVPSWVPSWVEIYVRAAFGDLELILHLLGTSESCWLENKAESHNPES